MNKNKEGEYHPPAAAANLDEPIALLSMRSHNNPAEKGEESTLQEPSTAHSGGSPDSRHGEGYDLPDAYQNLDEVKEPSPVVSPDVPRPQGYLEDHRSNTLPVKRTSAHGNGVSRFATELYTISYLIFFSILGTLARLGLQALTFYPGAPVATGVLWANVAGSSIMGFLAEDRKLFNGNEASTSPIPPSQCPPDRDEAASPENLKQSHASFKKTIPLYIGLSTGFCGSLTSFSSFIRDAFLALANALFVPISHISVSSATIPPSSNIIHRNGGYSFMALLAVIITTIALSISALIVGAQLAVAVERDTPSIAYRSTRKIMDKTMVFLAWGSWLGAIILAIWPPDRVGGPSAHNARTSEHWRGAAIFAIVFAPLGCLLRFYISIALNSKIKSFPLGTFAVNMLGTALEGMFWDLQHSSVKSGGVVGCQVLQGMMDGFCGTATTVSTWAGELNGLRRRHAWVYGAVSVVVGVGMMVGIMGGMLWGKGWSEPVCMG
ncbi:MAG: hypothetical protein Q9169_001783 [Polycauliona sp. 2 TL-2023]